MKKKQSSACSYTTHGSNSLGTLAEYFKLLGGSIRSDRDLEPYVKSIIDHVRQAELIVLEHTGVTLRGMKLLEIGTGQLPRQIGYFSRYNDVTGIDLDQIVNGLDLKAYWLMFHRNGFKRTVKTAGRKILGFDRRFNREMARQLGVVQLRRPTFLQMDATKMSFPDESFDCVYSFDVFEHLPDPAATIRGMRRAIKPGGVALTSLHPFTAEDGNHDLSIISRRRGHVPYWAHLRPSFAHRTRASAYLNKLSLEDWRDVFKQNMPGAKFISTEPENLSILRDELGSLREAAELKDYTDEELLIRRLIVVWQKT